MLTAGLHPTSELRGNSASHASTEAAAVTDLGLVSEPTAAAMLGIGYTTLRRMRLRGDGPPFVVLGSRLVRYREIDLERWLTSRAAVA